MTFTVDDLVASFNAGGHIGEEAIDIANLQAQLTQTLAYAQQQHQQYASSSHKLCNTPTSARTPTASIGNWSAFEQQQHRARSRSASVVIDGHGMDTVNEDCEMEDMDEESAIKQVSASLHARAQKEKTSVGSRGRGHPLRSAHDHAHNYAYSHSGAEPMSESTSPVSSSFATSDPFFAAAAQESSHQEAQASFFAQNGKLSQQSPFFVAAHTDAGNTQSYNQLNAARFVSAGTFDS